MALSWAGIKRLRKGKSYDVFMFRYMAIENEKKSVYKRTRFLMWTAWVNFVFGYLVIDVVWMIFDFPPENRRPTTLGYMFVGFILLIGALTRLYRFSCPSCGKPFHGGWKAGKIMNKACVSCGKIL